MHMDARLVPDERTNMEPKCQQIQLRNRQSWRIIGIMEDFIDPYLGDCLLFDGGLQHSVDSRQPKMQRPCTREPAGMEDFPDS